MLIVWHVKCDKWGDKSDSSRVRVWWLTGVEINYKKSTVLFKIKIVDTSSNWMIWTQLSGYQSGDNNPPLTSNKYV